MQLFNLVLIRICLKFCSVVQIHCNLVPTKKLNVHQNKRCSWDFTKYCPAFAALRRNASEANSKGACNNSFGCWFDLDENKAYRKSEMKKRVTCDV